jgi:hypothetical protein
VASVWKHPDSRYWTACFRDQNGRQRRISTKETNNKKALKIAEEFERAARTKRTLKQVQVVLDRLHEEVSVERVIRATFFSRYLNDWLTAKRAETALSYHDFYRASLNKFSQFLGRRADEPMGEITKQDVVACRDALIRKVSAKTVNHDLKALKMLFKSARKIAPLLRILQNSSRPFVTKCRSAVLLPPKRCMPRGYHCGSPLAEDRYPQILEILYMPTRVFAN